jgi:hypothetical protein
MQISPLLFSSRAYFLQLCHAGGRGFSGRIPQKRWPILTCSFPIFLWPSLMRPWWCSWEMGKGRGSGVTIGWTAGKVEDIAPNLTASVPARKIKVRTVKEGLSVTCSRDWGPGLGEAALAEFFILWQVLDVVHLTPSREDTLRWCWSGDGVYSMKSAYNAFFAGWVIRL